MSVPTPPAGGTPPAPLPPPAPQFQPEQQSQPGQVPPSQPPAPTGTVAQHPFADAATQAKPKRNVLALIALITAAVGFLFACIPGALIVGWVLLPVAFVLAVISLFLKGSGKWMGAAGLGLSIIGTIVGFIVFFAAMATAVDDAFDEAFGDTETTVTQPVDEAVVADDETVAEEPADARQELVLVETAFGRSSYDDTTWWYVAIFENPNEDHVFASAAISVEALDGDGTILDSSNDYRTILAGRTAVTGMFFSVGQGEISSIDVRGPQASAATRSPGAETGSFQIADITPTSDRYSTEVHGKVTSSFADDQEFVEVVVVARNPEAKIIGAEWSYLDRLPTGGTAQFEVRFSDPLPDDTVYEAYAVL